MSTVHTKHSLLSDLQKSGVNPHGTLLVHSSVKSVGECENGADTILDALIEFMKDGLLVLPTHTWEDITWTFFTEDNVPAGGGDTYDPLTAPSCVGVLTNLFLKREGVYRSLHPSHSVAATGKNAEEFVKGEELTRSPCPRNGCYGKLYDLDAQILFLGCDLSKNTFLHSVEEWNGIPDRLTAKQQMLYIKTEDGLIECPQYRHYFPGGDVSENYVKVEKDLTDSGAATYCTVGNAHCVLLSAVKTADVVSGLLKENPDLFASR